MRSFGLAVGALAAMTVFAAGNARAADDNYPWCSFYFDGMGSSNCGFESEAQCRATVQGIGGICIQNNRYVPVSPPRPSQTPPR